MRRIGRLRIAGLVGAVVWLLLLAFAGASAAATPPAGPPYPDAVSGQRVYDYAGIFSSGAIADAEKTIKAIEIRTGAQIAVYTQVKGESDTVDKANADALALMNQWGVGRKGFDDGLVILFDMQDNLQHGQVSLYAGSGFKATFMSQVDRQAVFDNDMKPRLEVSDFDGALQIAVADVNAAATPEHADQLSRARILNSLVGLGVALLAIALIVFVFLRWYTHGRDPIYVDDDSVLMPAPPDGLSPAMATLLMDDRTSSRTVSAAMVDLAARGLLQFRQEESSSKKTSIGVTGRASEIATPEGVLFEAVSARTGADGFVPTSSARELAPAISHVKSDLETLAVQKGWLAGWQAHARHRHLDRRRSGRGRRRDPAVHLVGGTGGKRRLSGRRRAPDCRSGHSHHRVVHAVSHTARGDAPGHARGVQANAAEDDGSIQVHGRGRRTQGPAVGDHAGCGHGLGCGFRPQRRDRHAAQRDGQGQYRFGSSGRLVPDVVLRPRIVGRLWGRKRRWRWALLCQRDPRRRVDDVVPWLDRLERRWRRWRLRWRGRRGWGRSRRRFLNLGNAPRTAAAGSRALGSAQLDRRSGRWWLRADPRPPGSSHPRRPGFQRDIGAGDAMWSEEPTETA